MKLRLCLSFLIMFLLTISAKAQDMLGVHTDNYAGVYSLKYNPAEIVDSRYKIHVNVFSAGLTYSSDFLGFRRGVLFGDENSLFSADKYKWTDIFALNSDLIAQESSYRNRNIYFNLTSSTFPSFMVNFGAFREQAFGFSFKNRIHVNTTGVMSDLLVTSYNTDAVLYNDLLTTPSSSFQASVWNEYAVTYGTTVFNQGADYVTTAVTVKVNQGIAGAYLDFKDSGTAKFEGSSNVSKSSILNIDTQVDFGYSKAFKVGLGKTSLPDWFGTLENIGFGADLGLVWEHRPEADKFFYEMDGSPYNINNAVEKYKYKVGLAIMDLGYVPYTTYSGDNNSYKIDDSRIPTRDYITKISKYLVDDISLFGLDNVLTNSATQVTDKGSTFNMFLPARINASLDYSIIPKIYANVFATYALNIGGAEYMKGLSRVVITPRYETKKLSVYMPLSGDFNYNINLGLGARVGPLVFGVNDVLPFLFVKDYIYGNNFYIGASIPIFKTLGDIDGDHISDKLDKCKDKPGLKEKEGCPGDTDNDGVDDDEDKCPEVMGDFNFEGCLDTDGDTVGDNEDSCINVPGEPENKGCPDSDGDGIIDSEDKCPFEEGSFEFKGCIDTDNDGLGDDEDACPEVFGRKKYKGCRDTDRDGVGDDIDECLLLAGKKKLLGCPDKNNDGIADTKDVEVFPSEEKAKPITTIIDTDEDGVPDSKDECVLKKGVPLYNGCPDPNLELKIERARKKKALVGQKIKEIEKEVRNESIKSKNLNPKESAETTLNSNKQNRIKGKSTIKVKLPTKVQRLALVLSKSVKFSPERYTLDISKASNLQPTVNFLKANPGYILTLANHTDAIGSADENMELSRRRGNFLKTLFIMKGISPKRIIVKAFGETRPIATNKTAEGRLKNQRTTFSFSLRK